MKVKWTLLVDEASGDLDKRHYARRIPGNGEWAAVCNKPELSEKTKRKKANLSVAVNFKLLIETCKSILNNPGARAMWQARYEEAKRKAKKHNKPIQGRLCDYVRHEVSEMLKKNRGIV